MLSSPARKEIMKILNLYAGIAFLDEDKEEMKFWKGQHIALDRTRKKVQEQRLMLSIKGKE
jgi:hypothetical protein